MLKKLHADGVTGTDLFEVGSTSHRRDREGA
jgi:hypothetical protein